MNLHESGEENDIAAFQTISLWQTPLNNPRISRSLPTVHHPGTPCLVPLQPYFAWSSTNLCLIWPQHGPQKAIRLHLLLSGCSQGVSAHQSSPTAVLRLLPGHVPAHGSTQGFGNGKCKHKQREITAPMSMAVMDWEAGDPSDFSRDPEVLT